MKVENQSKRAGRLGDYVRIRTGKLDANASSDDGEYPFFTCSMQPLRIKSFSYDCECVLVAGNGDLNVKYYAGKFDAYQRTYIIESTDHQVLDVRYLFHFMSVYVERLRAMSVGGVIKYIKLNYLTDAKIPLPPLPEQRRIAEVLDRAEALRAKRRAALAQLDTLTQAIFLDMFGDSDLPERTIGELLDSGDLLLHKDGNHGSLYPRADDFGEKGIPFLSAKAVTDDGLIDNTLVQYLREEIAMKLRIGWICKGDVLLAHNASVGKVALYDGRFEKALIGTSLTAFRPNPDVLDSLYLTAALRSAKFQQQLFKNMGQTTRNQVPITAQRGLILAVPPLDLQHDFARRLAAVEKLKTAHRASLAELDALFAALQHRAFRGEL